MEILFDGFAEYAVAIGGFMMRQMLAEKPQKSPNCSFVAISFDKEFDCTSLLMDAIMEAFYIGKIPMNFTISINFSDI